MLQKLKRYGAEGGRLLWFTDYLSGGFGKCFLVINPKLYRKFLRAAYLVQFYLFSLLESYCVHEEKDLRLVILDKLTWDTHLHLITAKANKLLGLLKRSCPTLTKEAVGKSL